MCSSLRWENRTDNRPASREFWKKIKTPFSTNLYDDLAPGLYDIAEPYCTSVTGATTNHSGHTQPFCGEGGLVTTCLSTTLTSSWPVQPKKILYTYMTSYLAQTYRLSILIDKSTLFINSWLIRLWVDNVLLINTRSLSIVIDKPIPLSIGISIKRIFAREDE